MDVGVLQFSPHSSAVLADLFRSPAQHESPDVVDISFKIRLHSNLGPGTQFVPFFVLWPRTNGHFVVLNHNVNEAGLLHGLLVQSQLNHLEGSSKLPTAFVKDLSPLMKGTAFLDSSVIAVQDDAVGKILNITSRFATTEGLLVIPFPVLDNANQAARVDVVKSVFGPGLLLVDIVDFEFDVRRNPRRLNGRDICTDDFGTSKFVSKVDCPNTGAGSDIDDF